MNNPSEDDALQFAIMLRAGLPAEHAILYFTDLADMAEVALLLSKWQRSKAVQRALIKLDGKSWQEMSLDEQIDNALNQHYASQAYMLKTVNYLTCSATEKSKLDSARLSLEAKKAGQSGKGDPLSRFFDDLNSGRLRLQPLNGGAPRTALLS